MVKRTSEQVENDSKTRESLPKSSTKVRPSKKQRKVIKESLDEKQTQESALAYLRQWAKEREAWKFQKVKQTWLIKHAFHPDQLDRSAFRHLVHYLSGIQGAARDRLLEQCRSIKAQPRPETPSVDSPTKEDDNEDNDKNKEDGSVLKDQEGASPSIQADSSLKDAQETWEERRRRAKKIIKALEGNR